MKKEDFLVMECDKCNRQMMYYAPIKDINELRDEFDEEFDIIDGVISVGCGCSRCQGTLKEIPECEYSTSTICELLGNLLEDNNRHNLTSIGHLFNYIMEKSNISENERRMALVELLNYYDQNNTLQY